MGNIGSTPHATDTAGGGLMRAIGYVRLSKSDQRNNSTADDKHSIAAQRAAIQRAADYNDWELVDIFEDNGKTGANMRRDGFQSALGAMKTGDAQMLVVAKLDRLSRDVVDFGHLLKTAQRQKWFLSVLDQKIDTSTAAGWLSATIVSVFSDYERRLIAERTRSALSVIKANGGQLGKPSDIPPDTQTAILAMSAEGMSTRAIAHALTADGIPTAQGGDWQHSVVARFLRRNAEMEIAQ